MVQADYITHQLKKCASTGSLADPTQTEGLPSQERKERMLSPIAVVSPAAKDLARR